MEGVKGRQGAAKQSIVYFILLFIELQREKRTDILRPMIIFTRNAVLYAVLQEGAVCNKQPKSHLVVVCGL